LRSILREILAAPTEAKAPWSPRELLADFPKALAAFDDPERHRVWAAGRGAAKTTTGQLFLIDIALRFPGVTVVHLANTALRARDITWPDYEKWNRQYDLRAETNRTTGTFTFPNGSRLMVSGADRPELFDRKRGLKRLAAVMFDEAQDWDPDRLEYAVTKVFGPRLGDVEGEYGIKGRILIVGTGTKKRGFFYKAYHDPALGFSARTWTQWENPHIADAAGEFAAACKLSGVDPANPDEKTRREWFAEFNDGASDKQVFKLTSESTIPRKALPRKVDQLVVAGDYGTIDACSVAVWLVSSSEKHVILAESRKEFGLSASKQVRFHRQVADDASKLYRVAPADIYFVGDGGSLGKGLVMDLADAEDASDVEAADKHDKVPYCRMMAGDLRTGAARICDDMNDFMADLRTPEWHPDHNGEKLYGHMPDTVDAAIYGYRKAKSLHAYEPPPPPEDPDDALERRIRESIKPPDKSPYD
jgi:hypothetical protein